LKNPKKKNKSTQNKKSTKKKGGSSQPQAGRAADVMTALNVPEVGFDQLNIGNQSDHLDVQADELVDQLELFYDFGPGYDSCLLEVVDPKVVADAINSALTLAKNTQDAPNPIVAVYHSDTRAGTTSVGSSDGTRRLIMFRLCVIDVGFLHTLRDRLLMDHAGLCEHIRKRLQDFIVEQKLPHRLVEVGVNLTQFCERYEAAIFGLDKLTPHQREKLAQAQDKIQQGFNINITAPAGAGKTFVALHYMMQRLREKVDDKVLFCVKNEALALTVARWIIRRIGVDHLGQVLPRFHLLFNPFEAGPRVISIRDNGTGRRSIETMLAATRSGAEPHVYDLVVVDEAHHVWKNPEDKRLVVRHINMKNQFMLLSDVSQSVGVFADLQEHQVDVTTISPFATATVALTEVVRSSKRIVSAAMEFQMKGEAKLETRSHSETDGPPLESFIFDLPETSDELSCYQLYTDQTLKALQHVLTKFDGLSLHKRLAFIVPDAKFCNELKPRLQAALSDPQRGLHNMGFRLMSAMEAARECPDGGEDVCDLAHHSEKILVVDHMAEVDGMEWLMVVCVGLETADASHDEARSKLYRGITRAHMMVVVVNAFKADGLFSFLTGIEMDEETQEFDDTAEREARQALEIDNKARYQEQADKLATLEKEDAALQAEAASLMEKLWAELSPDGKGGFKAFVTAEISDQIKKSRVIPSSLRDSMLASKDRWERQEGVKGQVASIVKEFTDEKQRLFGKEEAHTRSFEALAAATTPAAIHSLVTRRLGEETQETPSTDEAIVQVVEAAVRSVWLVAYRRSAVEGAAEEAVIDEETSVDSLQATVARTAREARSEADIDAQVSTAVEQWQQIGKELSKIASTISSSSPGANAMQEQAMGRDQQAQVASEIRCGKDMHVAALAAVQGVVQQFQLDQACEACWAARQAEKTPLCLDRAARGVLRTMISQRLKLELPEDTASPIAVLSEGAVDTAARNALDEWQSTEDAVSRAADAAGVSAEKRKAGWVRIDAVRRAATPSFSLDDAAREAVEAWVERDSVPAAKTTQSVWNTSENATTHVIKRITPAAASEEPDPESCATLLLSN
jgi:hypothetical protein